MEDLCRLSGFWLDLLWPWKAGMGSSFFFHIWPVRPDAHFSSVLGAFKGQYYPLAGSTSYPSKPGGMSSAEEKVPRVL